MCNIPTISNILQFLSDRKVIKLPGFQNDIPITRPAPITGAQPGDVTFCGATAKNHLKLLSKTRPSLLLMDRNISIDEANLDQSVVQAVIFSDNARLDFIRVVEHFLAQQRPTGIHSSAVIASSAIIASDVTIGPLCTIDGEVEISADTVIYAGVHIYDHTCIGKNAIIHSGTVIGKDGWGYERNKLGKLEKFPHIGTVKIGNDVEIGSNVVIDRGTLVKTVIGDGCKINNGTHIAHNVEIGEDT
ncbi:hypothetical protein KA005_30035, partial [bacterium]|nr:hypothetical protein [bacterium]